MVAYASAQLVQECPDEELLLQFDRGQLSELDSSSISLHLSSCERCMETLGELQSEGEDDPILACLKQCLRDPRPPVSLKYAEMEARAKALEYEEKIRRASVWDLGAGVDDNSVIGLRIGPYEVLGRVGRGGMGIVYQALQRPLQRTAAIKMILAGHHASASTVARFLREGKAVARLRHPNVVQVYDLGEHEGLPYLAMEYVEGGSLEAKLGDDAFEPRDSAALVATLAKAVAYAHGQGVVHRDIKPANILLGLDGTPKITDFGLAKLLDAEPNDETTLILTETDTILGTASYMAPEQAEGRSADISPATDVYALGAVLYALLTGHPPFQEKTKVQTLEKVRSAAPIPPSRLRPEVPYWLEAICLTCLEKSPQRRFPTAQALADDLERWLRDERPQGTPSTITRLTRSARKNLGKVVCGAALLVAMTGFTLKNPNQAIEQAQRELARGRAVPLIGKTGEPSWSQWRTNKAQGQQELARDQTWTISSWERALVELLPDSRSECYRINAQVRHDRSSDAGSEVGLYFARRTYASQPSDIEFFTQLTFNDTQSEMGRAVERISAGSGRRLLDRENVVRVIPHLIADGNGGLWTDRRLAGLVGPRFLPKNDGSWNDLEIIVTPTKITAGWNGQTFSISPADVQKKIDFDLTNYPSQAGRIPRGFIPRFDPRGGLGLYVWRGSASFRSVTVTPLKTNLLAR